VTRRKTLGLIGIAVLVLLLTISISSYRSMLLKGRETVLKDNLSTMRRVIKQYTKDKQRPPHALRDLVDGGYFKQLPIDPITNSNSTWNAVIENAVVSPGHTELGITDVRSGSTSMSSDGAAYNSW
jgi:general secretion pathway protein G